MSKRNKFDIELPQSIIDSYLVSEIRAYYDSEEGQAAFEEWLKQREDTEDTEDAEDAEDAEDKKVRAKVLQP